jgi:hypothetical protein
VPILRLRIGDIRAPPQDPNGGLTDSLDQAKAAVRAWETGGVVISRARKTNPPGFFARAGSCLIGASVGGLGETPIKNAKTLNGDCR